jgi:hypothetical protein
MLKFCEFAPSSKQPTQIIHTPTTATQTMAPSHHELALDWLSLVRNYPRPELLALGAHDVIALHNVVYVPSAKCKLPESPFFIAPYPSLVCTLPLSTLSVSSGVPPGAGNSVMDIGLRA